MDCRVFLVCVCVVISAIMDCRVFLVCMHGCMVVGGRTRLTVIFKDMLLLA